MYANFIALIHIVYIPWLNIPCIIIYVILQDSTFLVAFNTLLYFTCFIDISDRVIARRRRVWSGLTRGDWKNVYAFLGWIEVGRVYFRFKSFSNLCMLIHSFLMFFFTYKKEHSFSRVEYVVIQESHKAQSATTLFSVKFHRI